MINIYDIYLTIKVMELCSEMNKVIEFDLTSNTLKRGK